MTDPTDPTDSNDNTERSLRTIREVPAEAEVLGRIRSLNDAEDYAGIIAYCESLPEEARTPDVLGEWARAWNNQGQPGETEPFLKALELLSAVPEDARENHFWHFRRAYALYWLDRTIEARPHWREALRHRPGDTDTLEFIEMTDRACAAQMFSMPFEERVADFWKAFSEEEGRFAAGVQSITLGMGSFSAVAARIRELLKLIDNEKWSLGIHPPTAEDPRPTIVFSPQGWRVAAFPMREFLRRAPVELLDRWRFVLGVQPMAEDVLAKISIRLGGVSLSPAELWVTPVTEDHALRLRFTGPAFTGLTQEDVPFIFESLEDLVRFSVGEAAQMRWFNQFAIAPWTGEKAQTGNAGKTGEASGGTPAEAAREEGVRPADEEPSGGPREDPRMRLTEFAAWARCRYPDLPTLTLEAELEESVEAIEMPEKDPDCDFLMDVKRIRTTCPGLVNQYRENVKDFTIEYERQDVAAGIFHFRLADDASSDAKTAARESLIRFMRDDIGPDAVLVTGWGRRYATTTSSASSGRAGRRWRSSLTGARRTTKCSMQDGTTTSATPGASGSRIRAPTGPRGSRGMSPGKRRVEKPPPGPTPPKRPMRTACPPSAPSLLRAQRTIPLPNTEPKPKPKPKTNTPPRPPRSASPRRRKPTDLWACATSRTPPPPPIMTGRREEAGRSERFGSLEGSTPEVRGAATAAGTETSQVLHTGGEEFT